MTKYKEEYTALNEKNSRLLSEKSELEYELAELKASAENIQKQDSGLEKRETLIWFSRMKKREMYWLEFATGRRI